MSIVLNGTTGITTPSVSSDSSQFLVSAPANGGALVLVGNDTGGTEVRLAMQNVTGSESFRPFNSTSDARFDLGISNRRWKDLHLSGGIYVGGGSAANYLDDYEEGTWTPICLDSDITVSQIYSRQYIKIGKMVHAWCYVQLNNTGGTTTLVRIAGLPFLQQGNMYSPASCYFGPSGVVFAGHSYVEAGQAYAIIYGTIPTGTFNCMFEMHYQAAN